MMNWVSVQGESGETGAKQTRRLWQAGGRGGVWDRTVFKEIEGGVGEGG